MTQIVVTASGDLQFIWDDALADLCSEGVSVITRASHVEPVGDRWTADLSPVGGPVLGPYVLRGEALEAERKWLHDNMPNNATPFDKMP